jgi:hypothetical protein
MTGPDINRPRPGSNAIGSFIIGVSPIGEINDFDVWKTILAQYANSPILTQLIVNIDEYLDPTVNINSFFDLTWNVDSAQGWGLDVWGRIVGVSRTLSVPLSDTYLGFNEAGTIGLEPFNNAPFFSGQQLTNNFILTDSAYRTLIFAKALANICDGSIPAINQILLNLFPNRGNCYVIDGLNMSMTYRFEFPISSLELAIVEQSGALPRSTGVDALVSVAVS